ncbi:MAG: SH3 domain-containing protein [Clostridiales bacterium]|nr:SH3 domain-containing protein [Clostridiales bacterium]
MKLIKKLARTALISAFFSILAALPASADASGVVKGSNVNARSAPNTDSQIVTRLNTGDSVRILSSSGDYFNVSYNGNSSLYISKDFVSVKSIHGVIAGSAVNIRKYPSTELDVMAQAEAGDEFEILGRTGEWLEIAYNGDTAFIWKDFIDADLLSALPEVSAAVPVAENGADSGGSKYAVVNAPSGLNVRSLPSQGASVLAAYPSGTTIDLLGDYGEWLKVSGGGSVGYVSREFVSIKTGSPQGYPSGTGALGSEVVEYAKQFVGTPYSWGGTNLNSGVDCSGFVYAVMKHFGVNLNRSSVTMANNGIRLHKDQLQAGDLVFFDTDGANDGHISHVGIYMGNGYFIQSSSAKRSWGVVVTSMSDPYYVRTYVTACRVF